MRSQSAVGYVVIFGVIIILALIIVSAITDFNFSSRGGKNNVKSNEIIHLLGDVSFKYSINSDGVVYATIKSNVEEYIPSVNLSFRKGSENCTLVFNDVTSSRWVSNKSECYDLSGTTGRRYKFNCTISYVDEEGLYHRKRGECLGYYEEGTVAATGYHYILINSESSFNEGTYINTTYGSVALSGSNKTGEYISKVFYAGSSASWDNISWGRGLPYGKELESDMPGNLLLYHFNGNTYDSSGNNNHGSNQGCTYATGIFGSAMKFNGNCKVNVNEVVPLNLTTNLSYGAWFKADNITRWAGIISKMRTWGHGYNLQVGTSNRIACGWGKYTSSDNPPEVGKWYFAVCVYNGSEMNLYVNGVLQSDVDTGTLNASTDNAVVGVFYTPGSLYFNGTIDEVFVFNRTLSSEEIMNMYKRGVLRLNASVRSCNDPSCSGESWSAPLDEPSSLNVPDNPFFQCRFNFLTNISESPVLHNITIKYHI